MEKTAFNTVPETVPDLTNVDSFAAARLVRESTGDLGIQVRIVMDPSKDYGEIVEQVFSGKRTMNMRSFRFGHQGYLDLSFVFGRPEK